MTDQVDRPIEMQKADALKYISKAESYRGVTIRCQLSPAQYLRLDGKKIKTDGATITFSRWTKIVERESRDFDTGEVNGWLEEIDRVYVSTFRKVRGQSVRGSLGYFEASTESNLRPDSEGHTGLITSALNADIGDEIASAIYSLLAELDPQTVGEGYR